MFVVHNQQHTSQCKAITEHTQQRQFNLFLYAFEMYTNVQYDKIAVI